MNIRALVILLLAVSAMPVIAHHSFAMFDSDHQVLLKGKVTEFLWQNPHIYIHLESPDSKGKMQEWTIECANPGILNRLGWKFNMIKKGDQLSTVVAPLRTGEPGALLKQVKLADGRIFGNGTPAGTPSINIETGKPLAASPPAPAGAYQ
ncbi:MAG: DUF6152 family protein [Pseudomonadota bacterium]